MEMPDINRLDLLNIQMSQQFNKAANLHLSDCIKYIQARALEKEKYDLQNYLHLVDQEIRFSVLSDNKYIRMIIPDNVDSEEVKKHFLENGFTMDIEDKKLTIKGW